MEEVHVSRTVPSHPPSKRAKTGALSSDGPAKAGLGGAPPPSLTDIPLPPRGGSGVTEAEAPTLHSIGTEGPSRCPPRGGARASMLHDVELARERLCAFVTGVEVQEIASRGPEGAINTTAKSFAVVRLTPLLCM